MPIYQYCCAACGHQQDHLQKMGAAPLMDCPACGKAGYRKMVTAAGFHLKGSGWYATDFKHGAKPQAKPDDKPGPKPEDKPAPKVDDKPTAKADDKPAAAAKISETAASAAPTGAGAPGN